MFYYKIDWRKLAVAGIVLCLLAGITSCEKKQEAGFSFDVDSLVSAQAELLARSGARLHKEATLAGKKNDTIYTPKDSTRWSSELEIFRQLKAINKPVNKFNYKINVGLMDPSSNLTVKEFYTTEPKLPVRYLRIFYQENIGKPRKIEALYDDENALYKSGRLMAMHFTQVNNNTMLTGYDIQGGQKMVVGDSVVFFIKGKIMIN